MKGWTREDEDSRVLVEEVSEVDLVELLGETAMTPETARRLQDAAIKEIERLRAANSRAQSLCESETHSTDYGASTLASAVLAALHTDASRDRGGTKEEKR